MISESPERSGLLVLQAKVGPYLLARSTDDGSVVEFIGPGGAIVLRYDQLKVTEATGHDVSAKLAAESDRLRIVIEPASVQQREYPHNLR